MYKKISGVADSGNLEEVKQKVRDARAAFQDSVQHSPGFDSKVFFFMIKPNRFW